MRRCLQLARNGQQLAKPNPMVGAVIVSRDGRIIGEGYHVRCGEGHAEVNAFASVKPEDEPLLPDATIYVSLEPCSHYGKTPPCADLIIRKGVRRVVCGCIDPFAKVQGRGVRKIREAGIEVTVGVLEQECLELNKRFITYNTHHRPYVILKWAQTRPLPQQPHLQSLPNREGSELRDTHTGRDNTETPHGKAYIGNLPGDGYKPLVISTPFTKMLVHKLRAENDAILVGRTTEDLEHPQLTVREWSGPNPEKLVLSSQTATSQQAINTQHSTPNIQHTLDYLYKEKKQSLIVEGGAQTLQSFIDADLWDEIRIETAPLSIEEGIEAPQLPDNIRVTRIEHYGNTIITYERKQDED